MPRVRAPWLLFGLILCGLGAGCGSGGAAAAPGTAGPVQLQWWRPGQAEPLALHATARQDGDRMDDLHLGGIRLYLPLERGDHLWLRAATGRLVPKLADAAHPKGFLRLDGPLHLDGRWRGAPLVGTAATAVYDLGSGRLTSPEIDVVLGDRRARGNDLVYEADTGQVQVYRPGTLVSVDRAGPFITATLAGSAATPAPAPR